MKALIITLSLAAALAGCGKYGGPSPVGPPDQITYPKQYPTH
jgi:predicted small lipoprotein YifL